ERWAPVSRLSSCPPMPRAPWRTPVRVPVLAVPPSPSRALGVRLARAPSLFWHRTAPASLLSHVPAPVLSPPAEGRQALASPRARPAPAGPIARARATH